MSAKTIHFAIDGQSVPLLYRDPREHPIGTGFCFLCPHWVITAKHVVVAGGVPLGPLHLHFMHDRTATARVWFAHPVLDLAVLRVEGSSPCTVPLFPSHEGFTGGSGLVCVGYSPSQSDRDQRIYSMFVSMIGSFDYKRREREEIEEVIVFQNEYIEAGHSGGPILAEAGTVVGVTIESTESGGRRLGRATSIRPLMQLLEFPSNLE